MARIFISYRRDDAGYVASMVRHRLESDFGSGSVFMDIDNIPLGVDFRDHLSNAVARCDVLVALMGETWAGALAGGAQRRIDDPQDFVRIEIEAALKRDIPVVPVLIDKALMPAAHSLPETLRPLAFRNAAEVRAGRDLKAHLDLLSQGLHTHLEGRALRDSAGSPIQLDRDTRSPADSSPNAIVAPEPPHPLPHTPSANAPSRAPALVFAGGAALLVAAGIGWWTVTRPTGAMPQAPGPGPKEPAVAVSPAPSPAPAQTPSAAPAPTSQTPVADSSAAAPDLSVLDGYKIAIFFQAGDTPAGKTARAIRDALAARGVQRGVELRLATEQKMRQLIPPSGLEVRFDEGREDAQAQVLARILSGRPLRLTPTLKPVPADEPTPNFISVFVPMGG